MKVEGEVAVVTGASRGIGKAIALTLAREGADVAVNYTKRHDQAGAVVDKIIEMGRKAIAIKADVSKRADVEKMMAKTAKAFKRIDILVNNAGIFPRCIFLEMREEDWDEVINVNLKGNFLCAKAASAYMVKAKSGKIVTLSSLAGVKSSPRGLHYSTSKAGIMGFTKALASELAPYNIRVNCCAPGIVDTDQPRQGLSEEQIVERGKNLPLGRIGTPQDIAEAVLFLVSPASNWITGQTFHCNGGDYMA
jgi:3-oxoacyl-[acyl-carrier protein] reductase